MNFKIYKPKYSLLIFIFLITVPYLYPTISYANNYKRFFSKEQHLGFCFIIIIVTFIFCFLFQATINSKRKKYADYKVQKWNNTFLLSYSYFMVLISMLMNLLIVLLALKYNLQYGGYAGGRTSVFTQLKGINILSQLYILFFPTVLFINNKYRNIKLISKMLLVLIVARSFLLGERLALMELIIPWLIYLNFTNQFKITLKRLLLITMSIIIFICVGQVSRDRIVDYSGEEANLRLAIENVITYYADTSNKFYFSLIYDYDIESNASINYTFKRISYRLGLNLDNNDNSMSILDAIDIHRGRNKNMTNEGGLTIYSLDFGNMWGVAYLIHIGILIYTYNNAKKGSIFAIALYPYLYLSIIELPRFNYLYLTRFTVPLIVYIIFYLFSKNISVKFQK